eukprot:TRINITY_DN30990_c0_g1_i1.p1 TRINITY_DN30990_c0_g1~~TRINITY_DN30990_c0_g1_i1.p1  ORF type:complete len:518 (+),score=73.66 TRINITY_DN30990_c0_g1_i1:71-1624(+)
MYRNTSHGNLHFSHCVPWSQHWNPKGSSGSRSRCSSRSRQSYPVKEVWDWGWHQGNDAEHSFRAGSSSRCRSGSPGHGAANRTSLQELADSLLSCCAAGSLPRLRALLTRAGVGGEVAIQKIFTFARERGTQHTPLHLLARKGDVQMCALLLSADCSLLHAQDATGAAPLSTAIMHGHIQVARLLLSAGARPDHADRKGRNAFHAACCHGDTNFLAMLLDDMPGLVASLDAQRRNGLCYVFGNRDHTRQSQVLALLLRRACDANNVDHLGLTPLFYATESGNAAAAGLLFKYAEQPSIPNPRALPRQASMPFADFEKYSGVAPSRAGAQCEGDGVWGQGEPAGVSPRACGGDACRDAMQDHLEQRRLQGIAEMTARRQAAMLQTYSETDEKPRQQREARAERKLSAGDDSAIDKIRAWARDLTDDEFHRLYKEDLLLARLVAELRDAKTRGPAGPESSPAVKEQSAAARVAASTPAAESPVPKAAAKPSASKPVATLIRRGDAECVSKLSRANDRPA